MSEERVYAKSQSVSRATDDTWVALRASRDGAPVVLPWLVALAIEGKVFQVRLGTITAPLTGDVLVTDTAAEAASESATGYTIIPVKLNVNLEALGGTLPQVEFKSVGALITTLGTAFVPLNLKIGGPAASGRSAVSAAGGVAVAAEVNTTTRQHYSSTTAAIGNFQINEVFEVPPVLVGPASAYLQIGSVTTGSTYFANYDFVELLSTDVV
jgi:hypothetical protein